MKRILYLFTIAALLMVALIGCKKDVAVTGVKLDKILLTLGVGETKTLIATVLPKNATNKIVTWTSSNPVVASVASNGEITAHSNGEVIIIVSTIDGNYTASCIVKVGDATGEISATGVTLNKTTLILDVGETEILTATVLPENATNKTVTWTSSNLHVATVMPNGLITAISYGEAHIVATTVDGNFSAMCKLEVKNITEELLTQEKGWMLTAATCDPAFEMFDGSLIENLFDGFLYDCELDDIIFFYKNYAQYLNYGKFRCEWEIETGIKLGNWKIKEDENVLEFQLPYFYDEYDNFARLQGKIVNLDNNTLKLIVPIVFDDGTKLTKRGFIPSSTKTIKEYEFTLTYTKAK